MTDELARVLIWGCGLALIHMTVNLAVLIFCGSMAFSISCYGGLLVTLPLSFWGGAKIRQRGYVLSKKIV